MALKLYERYPQLWESPSNDYPQGAFKNLSAQGETDGSYLEKDWLNDYSGFFGALLRNAEMTPDGTIDTAQRSQFYDALIKVARTNLVTKDNITSEIGNSTELVASQKLVNDVKVALQGLIFDAVPVGVVKTYIGENAPNDKWLLCRGQAFSAENYPDLAKLLPNLKIPDLRGVALRGLDANRGFDPNRKLLSYQEDAMQKMYGEFRNQTGSSGAVINSLSGVFTGGEDNEMRQPQLGDLAGDENRYDKIAFDSSRVTRTNAQDETVMKNVAVNFIIKAR